MKVFLYTVTLILLVSCKTQSVEKHNEGSHELISRYCWFQDTNIFQVSNRFNHSRLGYEISTNNPLIFTKEDTANYVDYNIAIFSRWGDRVFYSSKTDTCWNGKMPENNKRVPQGIYFIVANDISDSSKIIKKLNSSLLLYRSK